MCRNGRHYGLAVGDRISYPLSLSGDGPREWATVTRLDPWDNNGGWAANDLGDEFKIVCEWARRLTDRKTFIQACSRVWNAIAFDIDGADEMGADDIADCVVNLGCFDSYCGLSTEEKKEWSALPFAEKIALAKEAA
jgi:hypothetical protein